MGGEFSFFFSGVSVTAFAIIFLAQLCV